ncbi:ROK family protein [Entomohabitans teleogrylli]|uniref:ROK family protein n=1 Tax=Entomohabitans teleogrylli TaxID=1384589 RepID=UPI00073D55A2|nr:ROK family protein [Entomohabitans teleogrylli]
MLHLGLDIGGTKTEALLLNDRGEELHRERIATEKASYPAFLERLLAFINHLRRRADAPFTVGIGLPGAVDPQQGTIKNCNCLVLNGEDLRGDLQRQLDQPVWLANDADCFTLSEATDGAGAGLDVVFGVIVGTGCGGGVAVRQRLLSGPNAIAGEWGHNPLPDWSADIDGTPPACYCGRAHCIERFISGTGLSERFNRQWGTAFSAPQILAAAQRGDQRAEAHYRHFVDAFARSLGSVINLLDPDVIVLGGGLSNVDRLYVDVPLRLERYVFSGACRTAIRQAAFGDASGVRGAAWLPQFAPAPS